MFLHEIKRGSKIYGGCSDGSTFLIFHNLDGMYSFCRTEKGGITHLYRFQELRPYLDGYCFRKHWPDCIINHGGDECDMGPECGDE